MTSSLRALSLHVEREFVARDGTVSWPLAVYRNYTGPRRKVCVGVGVCACVRRALLLPAQIPRA